MGSEKEEDFESSPPVREVRNWTKEEKLLYRRTIEQSQGFDVPIGLPHNHMYGGIHRLSNSFLREDYVRQSAEVGVKDFNSQNGTNFELVKIEKGCGQVVAGYLLFLTLKVRPQGMPSDYPTTSIQAKVRYGIGPNNITTLFSRFTPTEEK